MNEAIDTITAERPRRGPGIKRRWMLNSLSIVFIVLLAAVIAVSTFVSGYYYSNMRTSLEQSAKSTAQVFSDYYTSNYSTYYASAKSYVENFSERNRLELQFLSSTGRLNFSSSGLLAGSDPGTQDIAAALSSGETSSWSGRDPETGERIMAVSCPITLANGQPVGLVRYVSSLSKVDARVITFVLGAIAIGGVIVTFVVASNRFFIRSIVNPVREINDFAKQITKGSYGAQIDAKFDDEIGELCDTINEMSAEISKTEKMKNDFIASVSHELRTPLTVIAGWAETIMYMDDPEEMKSGVETILKEARRLTSLVEELLVFTSIDGGRMKLHMEQMDAAAEFEEVMFVYRDTLKAQNIQLEYSCGEDIPEITGDAERLKQVFYNILDNAAKHGGSGGKITTSVTCNGSEILIRVRDYGAGIPAADLPYVKQKFYKGASSTRGSGIGLAVANEIVELHGGSLDIDSNEGEGTAVTIRLPLSMEADMKKRK